MSGERAPLGGYISPNDHGPAVVISVAITLFISVFSTVVRIWVTLAGKMPFNSDDCFALLALTLAMAQSITLGYAATNGLGKHMSTLSVSSLDDFLKFMFTSQILGVLSSALAKSSVVMLYRRIDLYHSGPNVFWTLLGVIGVWMMMSVFALAFQCKPPKTWHFSAPNCPHQSQLYILVFTTNMVTDIILVLFIIPGISRLNMRRTLRIAVAGLFGCRLFVCVATAVQLSFLVHWPDWTDWTWSYTRIAVVETIAVHLSVTTANLPRVHTFLVKLYSGQMVPRVSDRDKENSWRLTRRVKSTRTVLSSSAAGVKRRESLELVPPHLGKLKTHIYSNSKSAFGSPVADSFGHADDRWPLQSKKGEVISPKVQQGPENPVERDIVVNIDIERRSEYGSIVHHQPPHM